VPYGLQPQAYGSDVVDIGKNGEVDSEFGDIQIVGIDGMLVQFTFSGKSHTRSTELNNKLRSHF